MQKQNLVAAYSEAHQASNECVCMPQRFGGEADDEVSNHEKTVLSKKGLRLPPQGRNSMSNPLKFDVGEEWPDALRHKLNFAKLRLDFQRIAFAIEE